MTNIVGQKFGRLIVIERVGKNRWGNYEWLCECVCGKEKIISGGNLRRGHTRSCGCLQRDRASTYCGKFKLKHSHSIKGEVTTTYISWRNMIQRCTNLHDKEYENYGRRGISISNQWKKFENFLEDMGECPKDYSLDRIDNNNGYCKMNCRWATRKQQNRNTRKNHLETYDGKTQCLTDWAEDTGLSFQIIFWRLNHGWSTKKALTTPARKKKHHG